MAISKIKTGSITDSAVNTDKLAPGSVGSSDLSPTAITGQTELSETAADTDFTIIYDTSAGALKKILRSNLKQSGPTFSSVSPTNVDTSNATTTLTITGTGFTAGSNARLVSNTGQIVEFTTVTRNSSTQITAVVTGSDLNTSQTPYDIQITNGEGISTLATNQLDVNASPIWITSAGSLGSATEGSAFSADIQAYDPDSTSVVSYELQSGALPGGLTLSSGSGDIGTISGTLSGVDSDTTYNFVIRATDSASNTSSRSFSITVNNYQSQSFTSSGTFSVPSGVTSVNVLVVAAGGGGGGQVGGGGGAGGLIYIPNYPVTPGGTVSVTVGCGGAGGAPTSTAGTGQDSTFGTLVAKGGGRGGSYNVPARCGGAGGSGGGGAMNGGAPYPTSGGNATQPTQPGNSGSYGFGNNGGNGGNPVGAEGGGGGGAGGAGSPVINPGQPTGQAGPGGVGKAYTIADGATSVYYAGGGGGGAQSNCRQATGGQGGGGQGGYNPTPGVSGIGGQNGTANRGGGGGGSRDVNPDGSPGSGPNSYGGNGGKGIVIVNY